MKTQNIYLTAVLLLAGISCRTKERAYTEWESRSGAGEYSSVLLQSYDSLDRFWLFHTDSIFYYRPGEGLYGHSGKLWIHEKEIRESEKEEISFTGHHEEESLLEKEKKVVYDQKPFWVAGIVLLIGAMLLLRLFWKW